MVDEHHKIIEEPYRYQVISEQTGEVLDSSNDYKTANKLLLKQNRIHRNIKLYDRNNNKTLMSMH